MPPSSVAFRCATFQPIVAQAGRKLKDVWEPEWGISLDQGQVTLPFVAPQRMLVQPPLQF
jgi:hypothetical protein